MKRRGWCELSSAEVACHAGSGASPFGTLIRKRVLNTDVGVCVAPSEPGPSVYSGTSQAEVGPRGTGAGLRSEGILARNNFNPLLYTWCAVKKKLWVVSIKFRGTGSQGLPQGLMDGRTSFSSWGSRMIKWRSWWGLSASYSRVCWRNNPPLVTESVNEATEVFLAPCSTPPGAFWKAGWRLWEILLKVRTQVKKGRTFWKKWRRKSAPRRHDSRSCVSGGPGRRKSFFPSALVSKRSLEIRGLDETVEKEEVVAALCMQKSPDVLGASVTAIGPVAAAILAGKMPAGGATPRDTWPETSWHPRGAWHAQTGARKMSPCLRWRLLPGVSERASEVEKQEVKFLQLNLGRGKDGQDLLMQTDRERKVDVLLISEQ